MSSPLDQPALDRIAKWADAATDAADALSAALAWARSHGVADSYADDPLACLLSRAYRDLAALVISMHAEFSTPPKERTAP